MRKNFFLVMLLSLAVASCNERDSSIPVTDVKLNKSVTTRVIGSTFTLNATILPSDATNQNINWTSSNESIAKVDDGTITALTRGTTSIIVTAENGRIADTAVLNVVADCNDRIPGWGTNLGTISFATDSIWTISGAGITQIWSDAVTMSNCGNSFSGGSVDDFNADCRTNPNHKGDLFSWCAVVRFQDSLCPAPWRVPSRQDFIDLDIALGGTGNARTNDLQFINDNYINPYVWGGHYGGYTWSSAIREQGVSGHYWSSTHGMWTGVYLIFTTNHGGGINPREVIFKDMGKTLRCVR